MRNTGKSYEAEFEEYWEKKGKAVFLHRVTDAAEVRGRSEPGARFAARVKKQPSDYILTEDGLTRYAEVKSSSGLTSFAFSQFEDGQRSAMLKQTVAGGMYEVFIYSIAKMKWYRVPAGVILSQWKIKASIKWTDLEEYVWQEMMETI